MMRSATEFAQKKDRLENQPVLRKLRIVSDWIDGLDYSSSATTGAISMCLTFINHNSTGDAIKTDE